MEGVLHCTILTSQRRLGLKHNNHDKDDICFFLSGGKRGLISKLADAWAPQIAEQYLLDNVLTAVYY
jgi:hypothetical protein